jgi:hypothetical protein
VSANNSYVMHLIAALVERQRFSSPPESSYFSVDELFRALQERWQASHSEFTMPADPDDLRDVLERLVELGIAERRWLQDEPCWMLNPSIRPDRDELGRPYLGGSMKGTGGEPPRGGDGPPPADDDRPGRGLGEIIAHPILFCLSDHAFEAALIQAVLKSPSGFSDGT